MSANHIVLFALNAWGHIRPLCNLAVRLVKECPLFITFLVEPTFFDRVETELARNIEPTADHLRQFIRVVALRPLGGIVLDNEYYHPYMETFAECYEKLADGQPVKCSVSGRELEPLSPPNVLIIDLFCTPSLEAVRKLSKAPVKVYAWTPAQLSYMIYLFAPQDRGGDGNLRTQIADEAARSGKSLVDIACEVLQNPPALVVNTPGLPPMYHHEHVPQMVPDEQMHGLFLLMAYSSFENFDGVILSSTEAYEQEAIDHITQWQNELSKEVYTLGPLLPVDSNPTGNGGIQNDTTEEIQQFLNTTLETDGPCSALYISFGSVFWPSHPEKIWLFLDVVMARGIPFILGHAPPSAAIPDGVLAKTKAYSKCILSKWTPQQSILSHPATGWFVTHCGQNSVLESLTFGVPMICWPFCADQPSNAARLSHILDVAYELFEVRTGEFGTRAICRLGRAPVGSDEAVLDEANEVLEKAFGEDGMRKREKAREMRKAILNGWEEGGSSRRDLQRFVGELSR